MSCELYYEEPGIQIYHGDCRELIDAGIVIEETDACITDPPYGIKVNTREVNGAGSRSNAAIATDYPAVVGDDTEFDPAFLLDFERLVLWGAQYYAHRLPRSNRWFVWDKRERVCVNDQSDAELAWTKGLKGNVTRIFYHLWMGMIKKTERGEKRAHPTQKPVALMAWCIAQFPDISGVFDPFMGSGTTLVAAKRLGVPAVGVEISEDYCKVAVERLKRG
jgi:site-specific DNA-methyltransferase (adenine-specific)